MTSRADSLKDLIAGISSGILRRPDGRLTFPSGRSPGLGLDWALESASQINSVAEIAGFWCFENPQAVLIGEMAERHDFLLVEDRFIIDGWLRHMAGKEFPTVLDLEDAPDAQVARATYGDSSCWEVSPQRKIRAVAITQHFSDPCP